MKKPLTTEIFAFEEEHNVVYIKDSNDEVIGYLTMFNEEDAKELAVLIPKWSTLDKQPKV